MRHIPLCLVLAVISLSGCKETPQPAPIEPDPAATAREIQDMLDELDAVGSTNDSLIDQLEADRDYWLQKAATKGE